jgi:hypothetical protein
VGVRGTAARTALDLTPHDGGLAFLSTPERRSAPKSVTPAPTSSRGPTYSLAPKPDIAAPGTARIDGQTVSGTSVAAARAAAAAVAVRNAKPGATPDDVAAALIGTAHPLGPVLATGAGELDAARARQATLLVEPATLGLPRASAAPAPVQITRQFTVANQRAQQESVTLAAKLPSPLTATVAPATITLQPGMRQRVTLTVTGSARAGFASGRITARAGAATTQATIGLPIGPPPPATLGALTLVGNTGVRFTAGAVEGRGATTAVQPIGNLRLELQDPAGRTARVLTPVGGAPDLLPGEYAYTLTKAARAGLKKGAYSFEATATAPAGGPPVTRNSPSFTIR